MCSGVSNVISFSGNKVQPLQAAFDVLQVWVHFTFLFLKIDAHLQFERSLGGTAFSRISDISVQSNLLWEIRSRRILVWTNRINLSLSALVSLFTPSPAPLKTRDRLLLIQILIQLIDHFAMIVVSFVQERISILVPSRNLYWFSTSSYWRVNLNS